MPIKKYFENINLLRGFAAITVVIYHFLEVNKLIDFPRSGLLVWFRVGWMAVDLFFVISGFVVGMAIFFEIQSADKLPGNKYRKDFFINRFARIVPLYLLTISTSLIFVNPNLIFDHVFKNIFLHLLFLQNVFPEYLASLNGATWSLAPEVQFYAILLLFSPWLLKQKNINLVVMFFSIAWVSRYLLTTQFNENVLWVASTNIFCVIDEFGVGFILARIYLSPMGNKLFSLKPINNLCILSAAILSAYIVKLIYFQNSHYYDNVYMYVFFKTLLAISFGLFILFFCNLQIRGIYRLVLSPFYYLGTISYGIYLWHMPVFSSINRVLGVPPFYELITLILISILIASFSWHFFEKPIINKFRKV